MSFFRKKSFNNSGLVKSNQPRNDFYGRYRNSGSILGFRQDKNVIIPGTTTRESMFLRKALIEAYKEVNGIDDSVFDTSEIDVPVELLEDIYSMYVNKDVVRRPLSSKNTKRHTILDKTYDSFTKIVTEDSSIYSAVLTQELAKELIIVDQEIREEQKNNGEEETGISDSESQNEQGGQGEGEDEGNGDEQEQGNGQGDGQGDGQSDSQGDGDGNTSDGQGQGQGQSQSNMDGKSNSSSKGSSKGSDSNSSRDLFDKHIDSQKFKDRIEKAKQNADKKMDEINSNFGKKAAKEMFDDNPDFIEDIDRVKSQLSILKFNSDSIHKMIEKILNSSSSYFSRKYKVEEDSIFDSEDLDDLSGLEFLSPAFRNLQLENVVNETRKYKGKFDLYLDCSGSMGSRIEVFGKYMRLNDLAKGIGLQFMKMKLVENVYFFNSSVHPLTGKNPEIELLAHNRSGGTDFDNVIQNINETQNNSVIVTDGEDNCYDYTSKAFFIGVGGAYFGGNAFEDFKKNKQCVLFDQSTGKLEYPS